MLKNKIKLFSVFAVIAGISVVAFLVVFKGEAQSMKNSNKMEAKVLSKNNSADGQPTDKELDDAATPIVDLNGSNTQSNQNNNRTAKNARFNNRNFVTNETSPEVADVIRSIGDSSLNAPTDLPIEKSDLIVAGTVTNSQAFLSNDKTGVYSEFTIEVSKVFDSSTDFTVQNRDSLVAERAGGRVRYPSGQIVRYGIEEKGSPAKNKKYIFFLKNTGQDSYEILTAYELQGNKIRALDGSKVKLRGGMPTSIYSKHNNKDVVQFTQEIETKIKEKENGKEGKNK